MKILTSSEMQRIDRLTTERYGIPSLTLMENAGRSVMEFTVSRLGPLASHHIVVLCGKGNNGGDGLVVARLLREQGFKLRVLLFADPNGLRGDAAVNWARLRSCGLPEIIADREAWQAIAPSLSGTTLFVDALLGTGLAKPLEGFLLEVVRHINAGHAAAQVLAVDLPTGISADSGELIGEHMRADFSVTFTAPKIAHAFPPACERVGEWVVKQIGTPAEAMESDPSLSLNYAGRQDVAWITKPRAASAHKGSFGHVLILAGSMGKTGAAAMAARAALRAGAGLVTVATAKSAQPIIAALGMEFMTEALPETEDGTISLRALEGPRLDKLVAGKTVLAVGPGIGAHPETAELVRTIVNKYSLPLVLDADGLNAFAGQMASFRQDIRSGGTTVFTPHPGEMARLTGKTIAEIQAQRVAVAREFSQKYGVTLVLKGFRTLVAAPNGQVEVNPTGNPGMAKGGTGDVLTGLMAGLLAQFPLHPVGEVATAAVYLHGMAGDLAAGELGQHSMLAGDLLEKIPQAYKELTIVD
ncbi:MAG: NAD(P)H-hydrate dehydratase [Terriglobia bacterium]|jgi:NAD(P)H-hydrate epimerase